MQADWIVKPKYDPLLPWTDWEDAERIRLLRQRFEFAAWAAVNAPPRPR
jgi:hypothetical protein